MQYEHDEHSVPNLGRLFEGVDADFFLTDMGANIANIQMGLRTLQQTKQALVTCLRREMEYAHEIVAEPGVRQRFTLAKVKDLQLLVLQVVREVSKYHDITEGAGACWDAFDELRSVIIELEDKQKRDEELARNGDDEDVEANDCEKAIVLSSQCDLAPNGLPRFKRDQSNTDSAPKPSTRRGPPYSDQHAFFYIPQSSMTFEPKEAFESNDGCVKVELGFISGEGEGGAYLGTDERIEEKNDDGEEVPSENKVTFLGLPPDCITGVYGDVELAKELEEIKLETTRL